jgi:hypothetical protein
MALRSSDMGAPLSGRKGAKAGKKNLARKSW